MICEIFLSVFLRSRNLFWSLCHIKQEPCLLNHVLHVQMKHVLLCTINVEVLMYFCDTLKTYQIYTNRNGVTVLVLDNSDLVYELVSFQISRQKHLVSFT